MKSALVAIGLGLIYFAGLMGASQALVAINASTTPALPWFPLPALALVFGVSWWVTRRTPVRIEAAAPLSAYVFALAVPVVAASIGVVENNWHGVASEAPSWPDERVSTAFQLTFLFVLPFIAAVLAEIGFRGIIQTRLEKTWPLWPMLLVIAVINFGMHFYDPNQFTQFARLIALNIGWGWITWRAQSIRPALAGHVAMNIANPAAQYFL